MVTVPDDCVLEAMAPIPEGWKLELGDQHDPSECGIPNSRLNGFCNCFVPARMCMCDPALYVALSTVNSNCAFLQCCDAWQRVPSMLEIVEVSLVAQSCAGAA